ncbi:synaptotagmin-7 [Nematostella vectensis]|uniref:synaptotagmin-7 n=1 Tax=Nematostella vectensis TaxID=45351 RepID=UPI00138FE65B|nr:synaptotagmin-7 [Nematostella vectensis]
MENSVIHYVEIAVSVAALLFFILLAILCLLYIRKHYQERKRPKLLKRPSQYRYISPNEPPEFIIPPYSGGLLDEEAFEEKEDDNASHTSERDKLSVTGTTQVQPQLGRSMSAEAASGERTPPGSRPQYRRALSSQGGSLAPRKNSASRRNSIAPYGKMQVSLHFVSNKSLLVIQINGTYDLPQLRTTGVSTPYVRVHLLPGNGSKDQRTNFMNLASNRICAFDRITLEEAKKATLKFVILDYDKFSRSEFVADIMMPLADIDLEQGETLTRHLNSQSRPETDEEHGTLLVALCQDPPAGHLGVQIVKAEGLPAPPRLSEPSSSALGFQVKVLYYVQNKLVDKKKTKVAKGSTNPVFNEHFVFEMKEEELKNSSLLCEVYQSDSKLRVERIGVINLGVESYGTEIRHWNEMMLQPTKLVAEWHHLHPVK